MSAIEWTDETWNPSTGCDRVSPGCDNCYALKMAGRLKLMGQPKYQRDGDERTSGPGFGLTEHPDTLGQPARWRKPRRVFVNSMSDLFHKDVTAKFLVDVFDVMHNSPQHTFQVLTKRPQRMAQFVTKYVAGEYGETGRVPVGIPPNVWLGTSIESDRFTFRADHLRATPAAVRFLSLEPLLGPLPSLDLTGMDWVIVGGESGPGARPMHPAWVRDIRDRCVKASVPFFFKQWGAWAPGPQGSWTHRVEMDGSYAPRPSNEELRRHIETQRAKGIEPWDPEYDSGWWGMTRVGKHEAGRTLDDQIWNEFPA